MAIMKSGRNVFLTGAAGAGKTYTLNAFINYLREHDVPVAITASTGIAATHMKGTTIHSWTGIGIKDSLTHADLKSLRGKSYLRKAMEKTHILIIDEISMLHRNQLDMINRVLRYMRNNPAPFGGMQVIFAGDFFQLPPVSKKEESNKEKFAFMSEAWLDASPVICYLTEQHRQSKNVLNNILNEMRSGEVDSFSIEAIMECQQNDISNLNFTRLYTHNLDVDAINKEQLEALDADPEIFLATKKGKQKVLEAMVRSLIVPEVVELKIGARVMFCKNDHEREIMNGTLGEVIGFDEETDLPRVQLNDGRKVLAEKAEWSIEDENGKVLASFTQVPLRLAWAITVHKSQGMTLEAAEIDLSRTFERGQGYVALSRLQDLDGLKLLGVNRLAMEVDSLAAKADHRFQELSVEAEDTFDEKELEKEFAAHILRCGGETDKKKVKAKGKGKHAKEKVNTYELTKRLLEEEKTIEEIMALRDVARSTVIRHLGKLVEQDPELLPEYLKPEESKLDEIRAVVKKGKKDASEDDYTDAGKLKASYVYNKLKGKYAYDDLHLALLYLD